MLEVIDRCGAAGKSFAFETTLAGKGYLRRNAGWQLMRYHVKLIFLGLNSADDAIQRVQLPVSQGGHVIPLPVIQRRFALGLANVDREYRPAVDAWQLIDHGGRGPVLVAEGVQP